MTLYSLETTHTRSYGMSSLSALNLSVLLALTGFGALVLLFGVNTSLFYAVNQLGAAHQLLWQAITFSGNTLFAYSLLGVVSIRYPRLVGVALVTMIIGFALIHGLKTLLSLPRPAAVLDPETFYVLGKTLKRHSFPSGHSATAFAMAALIIQFAYRSRALVVTVLLLASLVAMSRVVVGAHWPSDVLIGSALGWLCGLAGYRLCMRMQWMGRSWVQFLLGTLSLGAAICLGFTTGSYPEVHDYSVAASLLFSFFWLIFILHRLLEWPPVLTILGTTRPQS